MQHRALVLVALLILIAASALPMAAADEPTPPDSDVQRLVSALLGDTPMIDDLRSLTDEVGGRPTGSEANARSVEWALEHFRDAGVEARSEAFTMPARWLEISASAHIEGEGVAYEPRVAAMPYSTGTPEAGLTAPLVDGGRGTAEDFERLGDAARNAFVLIETEELLDVPGLFREYTEGAALEARAFDAGVAGVVYTGSRPRDVLHRHNASRGPANQHPMAIVERTAGQRALRLLRSGTPLELTLDLKVDAGGPYESHNVIGEIRGTAEPEEFVVVGAHLDSWGLGTGALDNGCNVALVLDLARQMTRLGIQPRRTIRFALWNGEEQGLFGSWRYTQQHADEMDRTVMASSFDIGNGRTTGFFTGGRPELQAAVEKALEPVAGLGPFTNLDVPIVGTDNYDFMMQGVGNLVANQESATYGPNYHAATDTFDKVDPTQLRLNAAIAGAVTLGFANMDVDWQRQTRAEIQELIDSTDLGDQMRTFGVYEAWEEGIRGRARTD
ncbi:MAG: M28 family peptidase [Acidobacteriota bacterium]|nr:M28 family peptidase [Acidobacteriota bacterium]